MKTIILPGFSIKNKEWANAVKANLPSIDCYVHSWKHWETEKSQDFDIQNEISRISLNNGNIDIIAKSVGTLVAVNILKTHPDKVKKVILNGIPILDLKSKDFEDYKVLSKFNPKNFLFIQNLNDNHGEYKDVLEFLKRLNKDINVVSKPRADHEYPYYDDFRRFLKS